MSGHRPSSILVTVGAVATAACSAYAVHTAARRCAAHRSSKASLPTVPVVDLARYAGDWHELARFPSWFQRRCAGAAQATYTARDDGRLNVTNRCHDADGRRIEVHGVGEAVSSEHPGRLRVSFAPAWLRALGIGWGDYWIIALADDYSWSLVGTPDRRYLWILARSRTLDSSTVQHLIETARVLDFPVEQLEFPGMPADVRAQFKAIQHNVATES